MNIAVAQSGGPTCAINATMLGVFLGGTAHNDVDIVYGSRNGIEGLIYDNLINLNEAFAEKTTVDVVKQTPSAILGSCRYKLPDVKKDPAVYEAITATLQKHNIGAFFYIGGNDSMDTVVKLSRYFKKNNIDIRVIGVPKTVDNDLPFTDHTPGFGSAAKYVATTLREVVRDSNVYALKSVTVVEIMGRDTGWLTASTCLLRVCGETAPHLIYLPEASFSTDRFIDDVKAKLEQHDSVVVAVSEGVEPENLSAFQSGKVDNFGHKYLSGVGKALESLINERIGCKVRSIELNVMQRCASHVASKRDWDEAIRIGKAAVTTAMKGQTGKMMTFVRKSDEPYRVTIGKTNAANVANHVKYFPTEWINAEGNNVTDDALAYFLPLIQGEPKLLTENGLPKHVIL